MSKYTTEVRYICESYANLDESADYQSIDEVIENSYRKIFSVDKIPMFNGESAEHRAGLLKKILLHYYSREIGYETVGLWKLKLNQKMIEIMPYYNQLYESELLQFDPLKNVDVTRTHEGEYNDDEKVDNVRDTEAHRGVKVSQLSDTELHRGVHVEGENDTETHNGVKTTKDETANGSKTIAETDSNDGTAQKAISASSESESTENVTLRHSKTTTQGDDTRTNDIVSNGEAWSLFSDTPQGGINGIANASSGSVSDNSYLTNATHNITTPDEQSVTQTHGNIVETYNADSDKVDTTNVVTDGSTESIENDTTHSEGTKNSTETTTNRVTGTTQTNENATEHGTEDTQTTENSSTHGDVETQTTDNSTGKITDDNKKNTTGTDEYTNREIGKIGVETYSEMLEKYRKTFLNIDLMVIEQLEPLFMGLW